MTEPIYTNEPADCDHPFRVTGDVCLNCGEWDKDGAQKRIRELEERQCLHTVKSGESRHCPVAEEEVRRLKAQLAEAHLAIAATMDEGAEAAEEFIRRAEKAEAQLAEASAECEELQNEVMTQRVEISDCRERANAAEADAAKFRKLAKLAADALTEWDEEYNEVEWTPSPIQYAMDILAVVLSPDTRQPESEDKPE